MAVGRDFLALRCGDTTRLLTHEGERLKDAKLPWWTHGVFADASLILVREDPRAGGAEGIWIVYPGNLQLLWTASPQQQHWIIR